MDKNKIIKYECKENDCLIEMCKDKSEILISVQGETEKTVIGLKDLNQALILFGVSKPKGTACNCESVETTDIRKEKNSIYYNVLCGKPITN